MASLFARKKEEESSPGWHQYRLTTHVMAPLDAVSALFNLGLGIRTEPTPLPQTAVPYKIDLPEESYFSTRVLKRISELTGISYGRLSPEVYQDRTALTATYAPQDHRIILDKFGTRDTANHELLHASQRLICRSLSWLGFARESEVSAEVDTTERGRRRGSGLSYAPSQAAAVGFALSMYNKMYGTAATIAGVSSALHILDYSRTLLIRKAIRKYGHDGWIALHAQGPYDPLFAGAILHSLEKRGFIAQNGFTQKGKQWIASLKPQIEKRLEEMERKRK